MRTLGMPGATRTHQETISDFVVNFNTSKYKAKYKAIVTAEVAGTNSRQPDITIYNRDEDGDVQDPIVVVEIIHTQRNRYYSLGAISDAFAKAPTIKEAFMYDYENDLWEKVFKNENTKPTDKCSTLDVNLDPFTAKV